MARTVCVTGAAGYVGSWLVKRLLEEGYTVRATVRKTSRRLANEKTEHLLDLPEANMKLTLWNADLYDEGIFDEAVKGCDGVFHVATPIAFESKNPEVLWVSYDRNRKVRLQPLLHDSRKSAKQKVSHLMKSDIGNHASKKKKTSENTLSRSPLVLPILSSNEGAPSEKDAEDQTIQNFSHASPHDHDEYMIDNSINEDGDMGTFINQFTHSKLKSSRKKKFQWRMVIKYARHRVALGAKFNRVDWTTIPNLPAPPDTCRRRMAMLRQSSSVRRALMSLCNLLADRYVKQLNETPIREVTDGVSTQLAIHGSNIHEFHWGDFDDPSIKLAVEEVIRSKNMKLDATKRVRPKSRRCGLSSKEGRFSN
ncbi:hypothetical protein AMTR_s00011p00218290 [Amborella trichopoda]|uniref:NmrA-like domain-containing protein n=1 Tax=Amborella trichopoda TaxID=13333 RepID=W1NFX1_AMBTC|nr:hypothetical protein AMTR_s00011p00218290 [Amborella trichopoda]